MSHIWLSNPNLSHGLHVIQSASPTILAHRTWKFHFSIFLNIFFCNSGDNDNISFFVRFPDHSAIFRYRTEWILFPDFSQRKYQSSDCSLAADLHPKSSDNNHIFADTLFQTGKVQPELAKNRPRIPHILEKSKSLTLM